MLLRWNKRSMFFQLFSLKLSPHKCRFWRNVQKVFLIGSQDLDCNAPLHLAALNQQSKVFPWYPDERFFEEKFEKREKSWDINNGLRWSNFCLTKGLIPRQKQVWVSLPSGSYGMNFQVYHPRPYNHDASVWRFWLKKNIFFHQLRCHSWRSWKRDHDHELCEPVMAFHKSKKNVQCTNMFT